MTRSKLLFALVTSVCASTAFGQSETVNVTIRAVSVYSTYDASNEDEDYRFRFWLNDTETSTSCLAVGVNHHNLASVNYVIASNKPIGINDDITLAVDAWEEDGCKDGCQYNSTDFGCDDGGHCGKGYGSIAEVPADSYVALSGTSFKLINLRPGNVGSNLITFWYCNGSYRVTYLVTYTPPTPVRPAFTAYDQNDAPYAGAYMLCTNNKVTMATNSSLHVNYNSEIRYEWYFNINGETQTVYDRNPDYCGNTPLCDLSDPMDPAPLSFQAQAQEALIGPLAIAPGDPGGPPPCCFEPPVIAREETLWTKIPVSISANPNLASSGQFEFYVRSLKSPKWDLSTIGETATVNFRVKIVTNSSSSPFATPSLGLNVAPLPPVIGSVDDVAACPAMKDGVINLNNVSGIGTYKYFLRPGFNNTAPCDPISDGSCFTAEINGSASGQNFTINSYSGEYTLWLMNNGGNSGSCYTTVNVLVDPIPTLALSLSSQINVSCNGASTGQIKLDETGGKAPFTFTLAGKPSNDTGEFSGLSAGVYQATVTDGCNQSIANVTNKEITVTQPVKILESVFSPQAARCETPGNGSFSSVVTQSTGTYDVPIAGPFTYQYVLYKEGIAYDAFESTDATFVRNGLPTGNYELIVTEKGGTPCNGYSKIFSIDAPSALTINNLNIVEVSCYAGQNGAVSFDGLGGSDQYLFKMTKSAGDTIENTAGSFANLRSGDYTLVIQNALSGCKDRVTHPSLIKVGEPDQMVIDITKTDITCFGKGDGTITAGISGGTPGYTGSWQQWIGSSWSSLGNSGTFIDDRQEGVYRLRVTDSNSCVNNSDSVAIIEPALLEISNVAVHDIKCFNEKGQIDVTPSGGIPDYSFEYSLDNGASFTPFTNVTLLNEGSYTVKTIDKNGCSYTDPSTYVITSPPSALDFTYALSDFNGYNISCYGGANGHIEITPSGGNGASYSGYEFTRDNEVFGADSRIEGFNAGVHPVSIRDERGCIVTKDISFTQTSAQIAIRLKSKEDIVCFGDETGVLELEATGGISPYMFRVTSRADQDSSLFTRLAAGTYDAFVTDKNNCTTQSVYAIDLLNPRIEISTDVKDVSCFEGNDGAITVTVNGGVLPLQYQWDDQNNTATDILNNVGTGTYAVLVTDNAGCKQDSAIFVSQPARALQAEISVIPVCYGRENGVITITSAGGTSPYRYSVDDGQTYQGNAVFNTVGVGEYAVRVEDNNGCISTGTAKIIQRNDRPVADFIVATKEHALDTLLIREISIPKPDSIHWVFDSNAIVLSNDQWSPQILFRDAGQYQVTMTGYFQACDYSATRTITLSPYDPNAVLVKDPSFRAIESVDVSPNPNTGEFNVAIRLNKMYNISMVVYDVLGGVHYNRSWENVQEVTERIILDQVASGFYLLRVVTLTEAKDVRIIIDK